jgi:hypothetical protein
MNAANVWPPRDIAAKLASDFPVELPAAVLALLDEYRHHEKERVIRCILHLAEGRIERLRDLVESANLDYRDVVLWAEYDRGEGRNHKRRHDFSRPFETVPASADGDSLSFMGGHPHLPPAAPIPVCALCSSRMGFFFQVELPAAHRWRGTILAVFHCVSCCSEDALIPEMLSVPLPDAEIPPGFLARYQTNFRIVAGDIATVRRRDDCDALIEKCAIDPAAWRVGAAPEWLADDETPGSYESFKDPAFLFQVPSGTVFPKAPGAPPQKTLDLEGRVVDAEGDAYELFIGNATYYFGFGPPAAERVYVVTQAD